MRFNMCHASHLGLQGRFQQIRYSWIEKVSVQEIFSSISDGLIGVTLCIGNLKILILNKIENIY